MAIMGRPTIYTEDLAKLICERVANNPLGLTALCRMYDDLPHPDTINAWRKTHLNFSSWYLQAKSFQAQLLVEEIDDMLPKEVRYYIDDKGQERIDPPSASMLIAKINNRKWTAARLAPKVYGERIIAETVSSTVDDTAERMEKAKEKEKEY